VEYHWSGFATLMLLSGGTCAGLGWYVLRAPGAVGRTGLAAVLAGSAIWALMYGLELGAATSSGRELCGALKYVGIVLVPPAWLIFALQYTGRERFVKSRILAVLAVEPVAVLAILAIPSTRPLVRSYPTGSTSAFVHIQLGPVFYLLLVYSTALAAAGTGLLVHALLQTSAAYRRQSVVLLSSIALVWTANILATFGVGPFSVADPTPMALAVAAVMVTFGVFRFGLLDLVPVARTTLLHTMPDPVLVLDAHRRVVDHNPAAERLFQGSRTVLLGVRVERLLGQAIPVARRDRPTRKELSLTGVGGERTYELVMSVLGGGSSDGPGQLVVLRDITFRKDTERRLEQLAHFDGLTGLATRAVFYHRLEQALKAAHRRGGALAVLFLDLDRFKLINDSFGHDVGDDVLVAASRRVRGVLSQEDTLARFGGDEFSVLLPDIGESRDPSVVADGILTALSEPIHVNDHPLNVHASIGIAVYPGDGHEPRSLIKQSDAAMYEAKSSGGNRVRLATPGLGRAVEARSELERDLPDAIRRALFLEFQPVVDLRTEQLWGYEALVRWRHPRRGIIGPGEFVPLAEEIGLGAALDRWVIHAACREVASVARAFPPHCHLCVNICPPQPQSHALPAVVKEALETTALDQSRLVLEVSERAVTDDAGRMSGLLRELRALGVSIALDDFGAGSTSLGQLGELPLDYLKIDRRFVSSLTRDEGPFRSIVDAVIKLSENLGIRVVAEGIETQHQRQLLLGSGCTLGQGFLFARPQPVPTLVRAGRGSLNEGS
jgi:diguanylate cyclase (GGDEF)-like protein